MHLVYKICNSTKQYEAQTNKMFILGLNSNYYFLDNIKPPCHVGGSSQWEWSER